MPRDSLALDKMVDFLAAEDEYWCRVASDPRLWGDKRQETTVVRDRHRDKCCCLSHYRQRDEDTTCHSESINLVDQIITNMDNGTFFNDSGLAETGTPTTEELANLLGSHVREVLTINNVKLKDQDLAASTTDTKNESTRKQLCPVCKRSKIINKYCKLHLCKNCCSESTEECTLTDHKRSKKVGSVKPYEQTSLANTILLGLLEKVQSAISAKQSLYILYAGGTRSDQLHKIDPKQLTQRKDGQLVESYCHMAKDIRHFYLYKIKRIEDHDWVPPIAPTNQFPAVMHPRPTSVEDWLKNIGLECYWDKFKEHRFDRLDTLQDLDKPALQGLGIPLVHQGVLLRKAAHATNL